MWTAPTPHFFKINVDGTWMAPLHANVGVIIKNSDGLLIGGEAKSLVPASFEETEAEAILEGMNWLTSTTLIMPLSKVILKLLLILFLIAREMVHGASSLLLRRFVIWPFNFLQFTGDGLLGPQTKRHTTLLSWPTRG